MTEVRNIVGDQLLMVQWSEKHVEIDVGMGSDEDWRRITSAGVPFFADGSVRVDVDGLGYSLVVPRNAPVNVRVIV
jgi:hypothetical protein